MNSAAPYKSEQGDPQVPETIVFLPGYLSDARVFSDQIMAFGRSHPVMIAPVWSEASIPDMARRILAGTPRHFALVGHSLGAAVAMDMVRLAPDRITHLAISGISPLAPSPAEAAATEPVIVGAQCGKIDQCLEQIFPETTFADTPRRANCHAMVQDMGRRIGAATLVTQTRAMQRRPDQQRTMRQFRGPTLVFSGAQDSITPPKRHEFLAQLVPNAKLEVIESAGHFPTLEAPKDTNRILQDWIKAPLRLA